MLILKNSREEQKEGSTEIEEIIEEAEIEVLEIGTAEIEVKDQTDMEEGIDTAGTEIGTEATEINMVIRMVIRIDMVPEEMIEIEKGNRIERKGLKKERETEKEIEKRDQELDLELDLDQDHILKQEDMIKRKGKERTLLRLDR